MGRKNNRRIHEVSLNGECEVSDLAGDATNAGLVASIQVAITPA